MAVHSFKDLFLSPVSGISEKAISLGQHGRAQELGSPFKGRANSKADSAEDAVDIRVNLLPFMVRHQILGLAGGGVSVEVRFYLSIVLEENGHIDNEVSNHREKRKRLDENRLLQESFNRGAAGQNDFATDAHGTGSADSAPA